MRAPPAGGKNARPDRGASRGGSPREGGRNENEFLRWPYANFRAMMQGWLFSQLCSTWPSIQPERDLRPMVGWLSPYFSPRQLKAWYLISLDLDLDFAHSTKMGKQQLVLQPFLQLKSLWEAACRGRYVSMVSWATGHPPPSVHSSLWLGTWPRGPASTPARHGRQQDNDGGRGEGGAVQAGTPQSAQLHSPHNK